MTREDYLKSEWKPYPVVPAGALFWGRVLRLHASSQEVELRRDERIERFRLEGPFKEVLEPGDWIAILENGFVLLAPRRRPAVRMTEKAEMLRRWSSYLNEVRTFFWERGFLEVPTPTLVPCPGTEPSLDVFATQFVRGSKERTLYLPTSPELHLKKALAMGLSDIFEIKPCFRNGEVTDHHQPEFTMLEWYRAGSGPARIEQDTVDLIEHMIRKFPTTHAPGRVHRVTVAELFKSVLSVTLTPKTSRKDLFEIAQSLGLRVRGDDTIDDLYFLIFTSKIEPTFNPDEIVVVEKWPPFQAALARVGADGWAERFEFYWQGLELANGFHELNDPEAQRNRFNEDLYKKRMMGKEYVPVDDEFLEYLEAGMPPSSGIALGLERLFMALFSIKKITDIKLFNYE